jgi:hypothetical protein
MCEGSWAWQDVIVGRKSTTQRHKEEAEWIRREQKGKVNNMTWVEIRIRDSHIFLVSSS